MRLVLVILFLIGVGANVICQEITHNHSIQHAFIENKGQWHKDIMFQSRFEGGNLWIQQKKFVFHLMDASNLVQNHVHPSEKPKPDVFAQTLVHLNFLGANQVVEIEKQKPTKNYYNYFLGNNSSQWQSNVYAYGEAVLKNYYNGIDLKLIEDHENLKYEFHVQPNIDAQQIAFQYAGHQKISIDKKGNLVVQTELGPIIEQKPYAYQIVNGKIIEVPCVFQLQNEIVSFKLGDYNPNTILVIDPVLVFATYSGSVTDNFGMTATYGHDGTAYSAGTIYGNAYPTPDNAAFDVSSNFTVPNNGSGSGYGITDVFVSKYAPDGSTMLWTTFLGGGDNLQGTETVHSLICDQLDNIYLFGATSSLDFPIVGGFQNTHAGGTPNMNFYYNGVYFGNAGTDIYVAKFSSNGQNLMASTYIGGSQNDGINTKVSSGNYGSFAAYDSLTKNYGDTFRGEIMLDQNDNVLIASSTRSVDFPLNNPIQGVLGGQQDGVVAKLNNNLNALLWSTFYGGSNNDACYSIKVDSTQHIVFAGGTSSNNLLYTTSGLQTSYSGGKADGFVLRYNPSTSTVVAGTYIGTLSYDQTFFVEIDRNDNVFLLGHAEGGTFPVINAGFSVPNSSQFVMKLNPSLNTILNSTVFGNGSTAVNISPAAFLVDICGNIYISGWGANILQSTPLSGMPVSSNAFMSTPADGFDFYLLVINKDFGGMLYGSYIGGGQADEHVDGGTSRFDKNGIVYQSVCGGCGGHSDFPTSSGAWSNNNLSPNCNNIIFKFDFEIIPNAQFIADQTIGCVDFNVVLQNTSSSSDSYLWDFGNGDTSSVIFNPSLTYDVPGTYDIFLYVTDSICLLTDTAQITITVLDSIQLNVSNDIDLCVPLPVNLIGNSFGTANQFIWSSNSQFSDTLNLSVLDSTLTITPSGTTTYYLQASNGICQKTDSVTVSFVSSALSLSANDSICAGSVSLVTATNLNPNIVFSYAWSPSNVIVSPSSSNVVQVMPPSSQYIYVTATASNGCVITDSIWIAVSSIGASVVASASALNVPVGSEVTLTAQPNGYSYSWFPPSGVSNANAQTTQATVNQPTIFMVKVSDGICDKSDTILIRTFTYICGEPYIYIPNAFTPNGDHENDILYVRGKLIEGMIFRIFDRWGEMVFESTDRNYGWDGTFRGKPLDPDVYDYYLKAICIDGVESIVKGNITLMR